MAWQYLYLTPEGIQCDVPASIFYVTCTNWMSIDHPWSPAVGAIQSVGRPASGWCSHARWSLKMSLHSRSQTKLCHNDHRQNSVSERSQTKLCVTMSLPRRGGGSRVVAGCSWGDTILLHYIWGRLRGWFPEQFEMVCKLYDPHRW